MREWLVERGEVVVGICVVLGRLVDVVSNVGKYVNYFGICCSVFMDSNIREFVLMVFYFYCDGFIVVKFLRNEIGVIWVIF